MSDETKWLLAAETFGGSFLRSFVECWRRADYDNQELLQPALHALMKKYPAYLVEQYQKALLVYREGQ